MTSVHDPRHEPSNISRDDDYSLFFSFITSEVPGMVTREKQTGTAPSAHEEPVEADAKLGDRLVAFADILGFKQLVKTKSLEVVAKTVSDVFDEANKATATYMIYRPRQGTTEYRFVPGRLHFSDTVVLWTPPLDNMVNPFYMGTCSIFVHIVSNALRNLLIAGIPMRVGIAFGKTFIDPEKNIVVGQPIIDAYETEGRQEWIGGAFHTSCPDAIVLSCGDAVDYRVPIKPRSGPRLRYALNWASLPSLAAVGLDTGYADGVETAFEKFLAMKLPPPVEQKYINARRFYKHMTLRIATGNPPSKMFLPSTPAVAQAAKRGRQARRKKK